MRKAVAVVLALTSWSCARGSPQSTPAPPTPARIASTATVDLVTPKPGAVVQGPRVDVRIALNGGEIRTETSRDLKPDLGHLHLLLDGKVVSMNYGLEQKLDVAPGDHLLQVEFVALDHGPFSPRITDTSNFTVR
ncbi:MAG TPA: hypothetical protein VNE62_10930 [Actinomycetota bacterium]|nr:hypothetical protein [Actinomycetota bacterium]